MKTKIFIISVLCIFNCYSLDLKICGYQGYQTFDKIHEASDLHGTLTLGDHTEDSELIMDSVLNNVELFRSF